MICLEEFVNYDPSTGEFTRKRKTRNFAIGSETGSLNGDGYVQIVVKAHGEHQRVLAHRLAWFLITGAWPEKFIDHINGVRSDNRIANLREASSSENQQNASTASTAISGLKGAHWDASGRWRSYIKLKGVRHNLGTYETAEEAHEAYCAAKKQIHKFSPELRKAS